MTEISVLSEIYFLNCLDLRAYALRGFWTWSTLPILQTPTNLVEELLSLAVKVVTLWIWFHRHYREIILQRIVAEIVRHFAKA